MGNSIDLEDGLEEPETPLSPGGMPSADRAREALVISKVVQPADDPDYIVIDGQEVR